MKSKLTKNIQQNIEYVLSEDNDFEGNYIKDELESKE